ncbi:hypothetical protein ATANTOWER_024363 [Ataeniobius toweri]|uniref:Uncharacterized protein n=1 Tax=Ataeniobius toweri TaxID=208326 RepID=A0ABU7AH77_9TELE|nr:hypothetical protein [Ataeniobius toweri]
MKLPQPKSLIEGSGSVCKLASRSACLACPPFNVNTEGSSLAQHTSLLNSASVVCPLPPGIHKLFHNEPIPAT